MKRSAQQGGRGSSSSGTLRCLGLFSRRACGALGIGVLLVYLLSLYLNLRKSHGSTASIATGTTVQKAAPPQIVILLQPSPVDTHNQVKRLSHIDAQSWGLWVKSSPQLQPHKLAVYAGLLPQSLVGLGDGSFDIVRPLSLTPVEVRDEDKSKPTQAAYSYMIEQFLQLQLLQPGLKWLLFANDHTFLVPDNLYCFLKDKNSEVPVYSGSSLRRGDYRDVHLRFASGGAGVVLSHVSLKLLVLTWVLTENTKILKFLAAQGAKAGVECSPVSEADHDSLDLTSQTTLVREMLCTLERLRQWVSRVVPPEDTLTLTIKLSLQVTLTVTRGRGNIGVNYQKASSGHERGIVPIVKMLHMVDLKKCDALTTWDRVNPGLVVAYCLQHVFGEPFLETEEPVGSERFNIFGLLRTVQGDVDGWYTECKNDLLPGTLDRQPTEKARLQLPISLSQDLVSFHYVSHVESTLLYRALSGHAAVPLSTLSPDGLLELWPKTDADVGAYSRKMKSLEESEKVLQVLKKLVVRQCV